MRYRRRPGHELRVADTAAAPVVRVAASLLQEGAHPRPDKEMVSQVAALVAKDGVRDVRGLRERPPTA